MKTAFILAALALTSCSTPADNKRLASIVDLALTVAERRGAITAEDAASVREAKAITLEETPITPSK